MKKNNIRRLSFFLALLLALSLISVICCSAVVADRQEIDLSRVGITYDDKGMKSLAYLSQDKNLLGASGRQLVTLIFDFYCSEQKFKVAVEDYNSGSINAYDLMRIGYPNYMIYESFTITEEEDVCADRFVYLNSIYAVNQAYILDGFDYGADRDFYSTRYRVTVSYYQSSSLPSYYSAYSSDDYTYATNLDYIYSGSSNPFSNFLIWCPVLGEFDTSENPLSEVYIAPVKATVSFGVPKAVSWSGNDNPTTVYTICTFFDLYNSFLKWFYLEGMYSVDELPDIVYQHTQFVKLGNDYYSFGDQEEEQYVGGYGWFEPWSNVHTELPLDDHDTYGDIFYDIEASQIQFSAGENVEYWPESVEFYKVISVDNIEYATERLILIKQSSLNDYEFYDYQVKLVSKFDADQYEGDLIEPMAVFRPYVGAWTSLDQTDSIDLTYDGSQSADVDLSKYYKNISFDMPKFDSELSLGENLAVFFKGFIMAFVTLVSSVVNNAVVWFFCESPLLSSVTRPLFVMATTAAGMMTDYLVPLLGALGVLAPVVAVGFIISFVRRNK